MSIDLTPERYDALDNLLTREGHRLPTDEVEAVMEVLAGRPKPALADGIYVKSARDGYGHYCTVKDGRFSVYAPRDNGTLYKGGAPLPDDTSDWTRVPVLPTGDGVTGELVGRLSSIFDTASNHGSEYPAGIRAILAELAEANK